jgi:hypothetical protein
VSADAPAGGPGTPPGPSASPEPAPDAENTRHLDLDAKRQQRAAARAEAAKQPVTFTFAGETFTLPPELPIEFIDETQNGQVRKGFTVLLGDDAERFFTATDPPSLEDMEELAGFVKASYGVSKGEAPASQRS